MGEGSRQGFLPAPGIQTLSSQSVTGETAWESSVGVQFKGPESPGLTSYPLGSSECVRRMLCIDESVPGREGWRCLWAPVLVL